MGETKQGTSLWAYLIPLVTHPLKVGCHIKSILRRWRQKEIVVFDGLREPVMALLSAVPNVPPVAFDLDSYPIGVNCHASRCMANSPHLFEDLKLTKMGAVEGIKQGLEIKGVGTFKFKIEDDDGKTHEIKIPNTLYLPELRRCLMLPQHWAQEVGDNHPLPIGTHMESDKENCLLFWRQGKHKKTIAYNTKSNVPIFYTTSSSLAYRAFITTFEAMEANFYRREHVIQVPGHRRHVSPQEEQEFIAEENLNFDGGDKSKESMSHEDVTIKTSSVNSPPDGEHETTTTRMRALTFDPSPPLEDEEEIHFVAADDAAELMRWHYRLSHLSFAKLKMLAKNGEIPRRLARVSPPKCTGCLFGAMTKLPWRGKESKTSHEVFVASKPGECVSVDHMVSTQAGFYAQLKGKLTNKRY
jgi:hypothetical protein